MGTNSLLTGLRDKALSQLSLTTFASRGPDLSASELAAPVRGLQSAAAFASVCQSRDNLLIFNRGLARICTDFGSKLEILHWILDIHFASAIRHMFFWLPKFTF
jgi:hypothetical protein